MTEYPIYEGKDIWDKLFQLPYYVGIQARLYYRTDDLNFTVLLHPDPIDPALHSAGGSVWAGDGMPYHPTSDLLRDLIKDRCVQGQRYIFTVYNTHHQQFANPHVAALNFDCTTRKLVMPWRHDQLYPGNPIYTSKGLYDDWGAPIG